MVTLNLTNKEAEYLFWILVPHAGMGEQMAEQIQNKISNTKFNLSEFNLDKELSKLR